MTGDLTAAFEKGGEDRRAARATATASTPPRTARALTLPGRSLLLVRNCGHHMTTDAVLTVDGEATGRGRARRAGTRHRRRCTTCAASAGTPTPAPGSVYIVKPKQHGPDEVALTVELFAAVEEALGLPAGTLKIGIMDEEKRTSLNLGGLHRAPPRIG